MAPMDDLHWSIHSRYVSYLNQTIEEKDSSKTEYTYARSLSYRRDIRQSSIYWLVPNMCRKSINSLRISIKNFDYINAYMRVEKPLNVVQPIVTQTIAEKETWLHLDQVTKSKSYKSLSICFFLLLVVFMALVCVKTFLSKNSFESQNLLNIMNRLANCKCECNPTNNSFGDYNGF